MAVPGNAIRKGHLEVTSQATPDIEDNAEAKTPDVYRPAKWQSTVTIVSCVSTLVGLA